MAHSDKESRGSPLVDYDNSEECDVVGEDVNVLHEIDIEINISSTIDSEDDSFVSPYSNWKVVKMTMNGVNTKY
jgi:hypothetical protein